MDTTDSTSSSPAPRKVIDMPPPTPTQNSDGAAAAPPPQNIGGLTLKKRAPGSAPMPTTGGGGSGPFRGPSPAGGGGQFGRPTGPSPNVQKRMERFSRVMPTRDPGVRMNDNIRAAEIRVIDEEGQLGVMTPREANEIARERGIDLIEIVPNAQPPVCKLIDFGKWKYEQQKRDKLAKKASHQQLMKEVRFHPSTDTHDFEFKTRHARNFLLEGHKVKASVQFKGREVTYKQFGEELLNEFLSRLTDIAKVDQQISMMGKTMTLVLSPTGKKKSEIAKEAKKKAEQAQTDRPRSAESEFGERLKAAQKVMLADEALAPDTEVEEPLVDDTTGLEDDVVGTNDMLVDDGVGPDETAVGDEDIIDVDGDEIEEPEQG